MALVVLPVEELESLLTTVVERALAHHRPPADKAEPELMSVQAFAKACSVHERTVKRWAADEKVQSTKAGRRRLILASEVERVKASGIR